jgi:epoxyqueuosine reductase
LVKKKRGEIVSDVRHWIVESALKHGASVAGIAGGDALKSSPSHRIYRRMGIYSGIGTLGGDGVLPHDRWFKWPDSTRSALVIGLAHPKDQPGLDWWDGRGTPGNRRMIKTLERTRRQIETDLHIGTHKLPYHIEKGGVFLKDAAVLAGLGCIGKNNLLLTPQYGPRIRLRALFLDVAVEPTGPSAFDPCSDCKATCRSVCPEGALNRKASVFSDWGDTSNLPARDGTYDRNRCNVRMEKDVAESRTSGSGEPRPVRYCRRCELVCPVGTAKPE